VNCTKFGIANMTLLGHRSDRVRLLQPPQTVSLGKKKPGQA